jgi:hypothetical protein
MSPTVIEWPPGTAARVKLEPLTAVIVVYAL